MAKNSGKQTIYGKAFEYACLKAIHDKLKAESKAVSITDSKAYQTARSAYNSLNIEKITKYDLAAQTAIRIIFPLEPKITNEDNDVPLFLSIGDDAAAKGFLGDVRDIICLRKKSDWEIGFSCKHNHEALKHPRITEAKDFGSAWLGYPCCKEFISKMDNIIKPLYELQEKGELWQNLAYKAEKFYIPILKEIMDEFQRICSIYSDAPKRLLSYFFGTKDFYKIISLEKCRQTKIIAFNMSGTLNVASKYVKSIYKVKKTNYPTRLVDIRFKVNKNNSTSQTTISLIFDAGWQIDMRLHNADSKVKVTGLKFDIQLAGQPNDIYNQQRSWDES